jgi:transcriptional regulator
MARMRPNPAYASTDVEVLRALIGEHPWAILVSGTADGAPVASHVPILLDEEASGLAVVTHVGRPDEEIHRLGESEVLLIVQGHHGYVSPSWYPPGAAGVPTWNYTVAHCYGMPQPLEESRNVTELMRLVERFEHAAGHPVQLERARAAEIARGTVGIRVPITRFLCKRKLSQTKDPETREAVIAGLRTPGPYRNVELARDMERVSPRSE